MTADMCARPLKDEPLSLFSIPRFIEYTLGRRKVTADDAGGEFHPHWEERRSDALIDGFAEKKAGPRSNACD
ncbi:MAG: hypothetical protein JXQ30_02320 [Spirochaetes bacterium]|nr:hypothetical protein [Spirochaetota bacterium]